LSQSQVRTTGPSKSKPLRGPDDPGTDRMRYRLVVLALFLAACSQPPPPASFADRAARAEALEITPTGLAYITTFLKEHGERLNAFAGECYAGTPGPKTRFELVADIEPDGRFENVVAQPDSTPTRCYARKIEQLQVSASRPPGYADKPFPVFIIVNYNK